MKIRIIILLIVFVSIFFLISFISNNELIMSRQGLASTTTIRAYIEVVGTDGKPFKPSKVGWYYEPVKGKRSLEHIATCSNHLCDRWSVSGVSGSKIYVFAFYMEDKVKQARCFNQAYDNRLIELSSWRVSHVRLVLEPGVYCE